MLVNAVSAHTGGGLTYAAEQIPELAAREDLDLTVLATQPLADWLRKQCPGLRLREQPRRPVWLRTAWEQAVIPFLARQHDAVYMLGNFAALAYRGPQVVVLHNPLHFGMDGRAVRARIGSRRTRARVAFETLAARASVRRATRAIAVSRTLCAAVEEDVGRAAGLRTITSGVPALASPENGAGGRSYALTVANDYPHKEWDKVIAEFATELDLPPLLIVGACRAKRRRRELEERISRLPAGRISLLGAVQDRAAIARLYGAAVCLVAHSRLEAAPLTPYEAISLGVPVAATDIPAHREACGSNAVYYDPDVPGSLARAVKDAARTPATGVPGELMSWRENAAAVAAILREAAVG